MRKPFTFTVGIPALGGLVTAALTVVPALATPPSGATRAAAPPPPRCSAADIRRNTILTVKDPSTGAPVYIRACGHASAVVHFNGKTYPIRGGFCMYSYRAHGKRGLGGIAIGLLSNPESLSGRGVNFWWRPASIQGGPITIDDSEIQIPGAKVAASGTVIVGRRLAGGRFILDGRTAAGPTGQHVTGSWTCG